MTIPDRRPLNLVGFLSCTGMMAYALYAEHVLYLMPCPLCVFERIATISLGFIFLIAAIHNPVEKGRYVYATLLTLAAAGGIGVAGWHVWIQNLPADEVPSCGPGFDYIMDSFPLADALEMIFTGSGECATIDWVFLGLSMPAWVLIALVVVGTAGIWNNLRRI
ncbi:MAG: disulfide bond formation protein B [Woeseiaceae bacterium]